MKLQLTFRNYTSETNGAKTDNPKDIEVVMPMCNLIDCSDN